MIGSTEIIIIAAVVFLLFGASVLPKWARKIGETKKEIDKLQKEINEQMAKWSDKRIEEVMVRMFNVIQDSHFNDHKASPTYGAAVRIPRSLGEDIADFVKAKNPKHYHNKRRQNADCENRT